jgi:FliP family
MCESQTGSTPASHVAIIRAACCTVSSRVGDKDRSALFLLFLPFLIIDLVVVSVLMSMGKMMLPPVVVSLPFKLIFFVLVDSWSLVAGSLIQSYGT